MTNRAIVTGAGQGVGRATAIALAGAGYKVALLGRTLEKLEATCAAMAGNGIPIPTDIADPQEVVRAFRAAVAAMGGLDVLVNCVADYSPYRIDEATDDQIYQTISTSLSSAIYCAREAIVHMRAGGGGDIVNVSSQSAEMPQPFMTVYGACKAGLEAFSQGLRYELDGEGFRVIVCQLGVVRETAPNPRHVRPGERKEALWARTGIDKMYRFPGSLPSSVAAAIVQAIATPRDTCIETLRLRGT